MSPYIPVINMIQTIWQITLKVKLSINSFTSLLVVIMHSTGLLLPFQEQCHESIFPLVRGRYVNLMTLAKCVWSGYCIDYIVILQNTQAQRPRDLERIAIHLHAGYCSALLQRKSCREKTALPSSRVNVRGVCFCKIAQLKCIFRKVMGKWLLGCCCGSCSLIHENYSWGS